MVDSLESLILEALCSKADKTKVNCQKISDGLLMRQIRLYNSQKYQNLMY